jgi:hypothetical protein
MLWKWTEGRLWNSHERLDGEAQNPRRNQIKVGLKPDPLQVRRIAPGVGESSRSVEMKSCFKVTDNSRNTSCTHEKPDRAGTRESVLARPGPGGLLEKCRPTSAYTFPTALPVPVEQGLILLVPAPIGSSGLALKMRKYISMCAVCSP